MLSSCNCITSVEYTSSSFVTFSITFLFFFQFHCHIIDIFEFSHYLYSITPLHDPFLQRVSANEWINIFHLFVSISVWLVCALCSLSNDEVDEMVLFHQYLGYCHIESSESHQMNFAWHSKQSLSANICLFGNPIYFRVGHRRYTCRPPQQFMFENIQLYWNWCYTVRCHRGGQKFVSLHQHMRYINRHGTWYWAQYHIASAILAIIGIFEH